MDNVDVIEKVVTEEPELPVHIPYANYNSPGIASFNSTDFHVEPDGEVQLSKEIKAIRDDAEDAAAAAASSAGEAATHAQNAQTAAANAANSATTATGAASQAVVHASQAEQSAQDAADSATEAEGYKDTATQQAQAAASSASAAAQSASNAVVSANTATDAKTAAQTAATNAEQSATDAETSAGNAETSASQAADSALLAQQYRDQAKEYAQKEYQIYDSFDALPRPGNSAFIYLVPASELQTNDKYNEYLWIDNINDYEYLGAVNDIDLSNYAQQNGTYPNMSVGKATADANGNNIVNTYATKAENNAKYTKPSGGIPESDLASAVQTSLNKADTAYQKPSTGIPETDLAQAVKDKLNTPSGIKLNQVIERLDALPLTVDENTADIIAIGEADNTQFYFKKSPLKNLEAVPPIIKIETYQGSMFSDQQADVNILGGDDSIQYNWVLNKGDFANTISDLSITPNGKTCKVSLTAEPREHVLDLSGTATLICTNGDKTIEIPIEITINACLTGDTLITMSNGSKKRIDEIEVGEKVLSYNPNNGLLEPDIIYFADSQFIKTHDHYDRYEFDDGTVIKVVHRHRFYNVDKQAMVHLDCWEIGDRAFKQNGTTPKLIKAEPHYEDVETRHYTIFTVNQNYFANGILSGNRFTNPIKKGGEQ